MRSRFVLVPVTALLAGLLALGAAACGSGKAADAGAANAPTSPTTKEADAAAAAPDAAPPPKPFAGSAAEATQLIGAAVDKGAAEVQKCINDYRARKNLPHERVTIQMGIDQEGKLLGATLPKGKTDAVLSACVISALANAPFPRSHSGVISITKSYEEIVQ